MENYGSIDKYFIRFDGEVWIMPDSYRQAHKGILALCTKHIHKCSECPLCAACDTQKINGETDDSFAARWESAMLEAYRRSVSA